MCIYAQMPAENKSHSSAPANALVISADAKSAGHHKERSKAEDHKKKFQLFLPEDRDRIFHGISEVILIVFDSNFVVSMSF